MAEPLRERVPLGVPDSVPLLLRVPLPVREPESPPEGDTEDVAVPNGELEGLAVTDLVTVRDTDGVAEGV